MTVQYAIHEQQPRATPTEAAPGPHQMDHHTRPHPHIEETIKIEPTLLKSNDGDRGSRTIHNLPDTCQRKQHTASCLGKIWTTTNWICRKMGYPAPGDQDDLQAAYAKTTTELETPLYREPQRAHMPGNEVVTALEGGTCDTTKSAVYRYYASA